MLNGITDDTTIYKFMPLPFTLSMVRDNLLCLNRISSWQDVYENYMLKQNYFLADGTQIGVDHMTSGIYGQCWTDMPESDAMWRIYSPNKRTIRIKTTVEKLFDTLYKSDGNMADTYVGRVNYLYQSDIDAAVQLLSPLPQDVFIKEVVKGAFVKRIEFHHEQEIRIIRILDSEQTALADPLLKFPIPADFIEEFCIDPRADENVQDIISAQLQEVGVQPDLIVKSQLYHFNAHNIQFS